MPPPSVCCSIFPLKRDKAAGCQHVDHLAVESLQVTKSQRLASVIFSQMPLLFRRLVLCGASAAPLYVFTTGPQPCSAVAVDSWHWPQRGHRCFCLSRPMVPPTPALPLRLGHGGLFPSAPPGLGRAGPLSSLPLVNQRPHAQGPGDPRWVLGVLPACRTEQVPPAGRQAGSSGTGVGE